MTTPKNKKRPCPITTSPSEAVIQIALIQWLTREFPFEHTLVYHVPNGGKRSKRTGASLKHQGVRRGIPDLVLPFARGGYSHMYLELKTKKGHLSKDQVFMIAALQREGAHVVVCYGLEEAQTAIREYLALAPTELKKPAPCAVPPVGKT